MYKKIGKRLGDIFLSIIVLIITSPIFISVLILLFVQNRGKVFFFQERPGKDLKSFYIIKFKTMNDRIDSTGNLLPDVQRMTKVGRWVRKLSIDELPQLTNVLKGEMSLVGPRPLLFKYIPLYAKKQLRRHEVRPGITGWAQVNGRNTISWTRKFELDVEYVDNISLSLDARIVWMTIKKILLREGINQSEDRPMQPFNGKN
jgi:undecaprenyl phosphate N,N'-diacetylbacillosamine 1-phosphate transferase